ncbi:MAG: sigma-70 family RNA polymerase sigma factor [Polyangiaceae bacterium]
MTAALLMDDSDSYLSLTEAVTTNAATEKRLEALVEGQYEFVWRQVRRLGVRDGDADDAAQQVFLVAARKLAQIREGCERSFSYQTALRVSSDYRRSSKRRYESSLSDLPDQQNRDDRQPSTDELLDLRRARQRLDEVLDQLPMDLRAVFVLHELEQTTMADIAELLDLPSGTVASRLRRARQQFYDLLERSLGRRRPSTGAEP